jgi:Cysteine-rich secretory protein family
MRALLALLIAVVGVVRADADTVWNVTVKRASGGSTELRSIDGNPNDMLPRCRCVTGVWRPASESATHFVGTLEDVTANHPRKATKAIRAKIRKTRKLLGVHRDYRETLHGIVRGSGQLVLREVTGGEWEVVAFTDAIAGNIFATLWRADPDHPPKPAKPAPFVDTAADANTLVKLINDYRASIDLPRVPVSKAMTKVAQAHVHDLNVNKPVSDRCNMHSWSTKGKWSACCYDGSKAAARCMWKKPKEIGGHAGNGYEIAANASGITPAHALELWQNSPAHHAVMINKNQWTKPWRAMGVAVEGDYAVAWFGEESD